MRRGAHSRRRQGRYAGLGAPRVGSGKSEVGNGAKGRRRQGPAGGGPRARASGFPFTAEARAGAHWGGRLTLPPAPYTTPPPVRVAASTTGRPSSVRSGQGAQPWRSGGPGALSPRRAAVTWAAQHLPLAGPAEDRRQSRELLLSRPLHGHAAPAQHRPFRHGLQRLEQRGGRPPGGAPRLRSQQRASRGPRGPKKAARSSCFLISQGRLCLLERLFWRSKAQWPGLSSHSYSRHWTLTVPPGLGLVCGLEDPPGERNLIRKKISREVTRRD